MSHGSGDDKEPDVVRLSIGGKQEKSLTIGPVVQRRSDDDLAIDERHFDLASMPCLVEDFLFDVRRVAREVADEKDGFELGERNHHALARRRRHRRPDVEMRAGRMKVLGESLEEIAPVPDNDPVPAIRIGRQVSSWGTTSEGWSLSSGRLKANATVSESICQIRYLTPQDAERHDGVLSVSNQFEHRFRARPQLKVRFEQCSAH